MNETKFLVLTHVGMYVDESFIHKGIYITSTLRLRDQNDTIESIINKINNFPDRVKVGWENKAIENLKQCILTPFELKPL